MKQLILIGLSLILFGSIGHGEETHPPPIILRQAKAKVMIEKTWYEKVSDKFESKREIICTKEIIIDVYEIQKNVGLPFNDLKHIDCETKVNQNNFFARITPIIMEGFADETIPLVPTGQRLKAMTAALSVSAPASRTQDPLWQSFLSDDLSLKSGILMLSPIMYSNSCSDEHGVEHCLPSNNPEAYFSAIVKFEDNL